MIRLNYHLKNGGTLLKQENNNEWSETYKILALVALVISTGAIAYWLAQIADLLEVIANK